MIYSFLADLLVVFHLVFILYVMAGALLIHKMAKNTLAPPAVMLLGDNR